MASSVPAWRPPFGGVVDQLNCSVRDREAGEGQLVLAGSTHHLFDLGLLPTKQGGDGVELLGDVLGAGFPAND